MPFSQYHLTNADERIVELGKLIDEQRALVQKLQDGSGDIRVAEQHLTSLQRTLQMFREHRTQIEERSRQTKV
jgi:hypothetical protein